MSIRATESVRWQGRRYAIVAYDSQLPMEPMTSFAPQPPLVLAIEQGRLYRENGEPTAYTGRLLLGQDDMPMADRRYWTYDLLLQLRFADGVLTEVQDLSALAADVRARVETDAEFAERVWMRRDLPPELDRLWFS